MDVKILGSGCANCRALEANTTAVLDRLGITATVGHVTDPADIAGYGVMRTPALVVDNRVVVSGRVPTTDQLARLIDER